MSYPQRNDGPSHWSDPVLSPEMLLQGPPAGPFNDKAGQRMWYAIKTQNHEGVRRALQEGANPNRIGPVDGYGKPWSALSAALHARETVSKRPWNANVVRELLEAGANPNAACHGGGNVALSAWQYSHQDSESLTIARWMVEHPWTDVNAQTSGGSTMLSMATYAPSLIATLVHRGADPHAFSESTTMLGMALRWGVTSEPDVVRAFVQLGVDVNAHPPHGQAALPNILQAVRTCNLRTVEALLDAGADPYLDSQGTPLEFWVERHPQREAIMTMLRKARLPGEHAALIAAATLSDEPSESRLRSRL